ncbi:hypothetical protein R1sor_012118 [Riccia sorocarpa]|uniref:Uncharacterized protein n=1 Tax=Riccia sorocarpa TaxID=122646 RepID=A0ABD3I2W8_9MARC
METAVLHPQDHLAQERYGYHSRMMSGMIYPLGGLPRTRRKVKTPSQVFAASIQSDNVRVSSNQNVHAVDTSNGPSELTFGALRGARFSSSPSSRHSSGLSAPQYRLLTTTPSSHGFTKSESARSEATSPVKPKQHAAGSPFSSSLAFNGGSSGPAPVARTRSDGELLSFKKGGEVDKTADRRRSSFEKNSDNNKNGYERKATEKMMVEKVEKPIERRKSFEKKPTEKKAAVYKNQDDKPVSAPKKGVITILQRPQTKEAAVENLAKITGIPVESLQGGLKPNRTPQPQSSEVPRKDVDLGLYAVSTEDVQEVVGSPKGSESGSSYTSKGRPGSPKGGNGKKKSARADNNRASGFREKMGRTSSGGNSAYSARVYVEKEEKSKREDREVSPVSSESSREDSGATKTFLLSPGLLNLSPEDYSAAQSLSSSSVQLKKSSARSIISTTTEGVLVHKAHDEQVVKHASPRSDNSSREMHRRSESCDVFCLPSSPPTAAAERWAGPAYTNSPPPSNLPFPTFPTQRPKSSLLGMSLVGLVDPLVPDVVPVKASSAPSSPTRVTSVFFSERRTESRVDSKGLAARVDPSSATKDLRRILNLDIECASGGEAEVSPVLVNGFLLTSSLQVEEQLSATQISRRDEMLACLRNSPEDAREVSATGDRSLEEICRRFIDACVGRIMAQASADLRVGIEEQWLLFPE